jgi:hypothetical protein
MAGFGDHFFLHRWACGGARSGWPACGQTSPLATAVTLRVRRSARPCPRSQARLATGILARGQARELGEHGGWLRLTVSRY